MSRCVRHQTGVGAVVVFPPQFVDPMQHERPSGGITRTNRSIVVEKRTTWCPVSAGGPSEWNLLPVCDYRIL
jgi:hypothetical protein